MYSNSYSFKQNNKTLKKCKKILSLFEQLDPKKIYSRPSSSKKQNNPYYISQSSKKPSIPQYSFMRSNQDSVKKVKNKNQEVSFLRQSVSKIQTPSRCRSILRQRSNESFVSTYNKQSRYQKIMKLKVKPSYKKSNFQSKKSLLNSSFNSLNSSRSSLNKQNRNCNKQSRLEKIMKIKIQKPKVNSTLINYQPLKCSKSSSKKSIRDKSISISLVQHKESKKLFKNKQKIQQKQQRLWKQFQRERELHQKQKKKEEQKFQLQRKRRESKFEKMVQKELKRISTEKQIQRRKKQGFSPYVFPAY